MFVFLKLALDVNVFMLAVVLIQYCLNKPLGGNINLKDSKKCN